MKRENVLDRNLIVASVMALLVFVGTIRQYAEVSSKQVNNSAESYQYSVIENVGVKEIENVEEIVTIEENTYISNSNELNDEECYMLAKIAMAEAESENIEGKALVINVVLNRVKHEKFPDSIEEVIFEEGQFTPTQNGRWENVEPNEECWEALRMVQEEGFDRSMGALFFESQGEKSWHWNNLKPLMKHGSHYFYTFW